jgi:long-chain fatty acid transport protein
VLPSIASRINQSLSLGASLNVMYGKPDNKVAVNNIIGPDARLWLDDATWGVGANLGLLYELDPGTRFGITYTSPVKLDFSAQPQWSGLAPGLQALLPSRGLLDARTDLGVTVPQGCTRATTMRSTRAGSSWAASAGSNGPGSARWRSESTRTTPSG